MRLSTYLHRHSRQLTICQNEFDRYIGTPPPAQKIKALEYWKNHTSDFPQPLDTERRRAERRKAKKNPKRAGEEASDSEDDEIDDPDLIAWELEQRLFIKYVAA